MRSILSQCFNIPPPTLTERNLPDQIGRVHIVTEGYTGCGLELAKILYQRNGTVYIAGRSKDKADKAIKLMRTAHPHSKGKAEFLYLDLADMRSIKPAVERFLSLEKRLDTLTNNAGIMAPPFGSKTAQDFELQLGTNVLGPWAFSHMLTPLLKETAAVTAPGTVRITWASSIAVDLLSPKPGGVIFDLATGHPVTFKSQDVNYGQSKAANTLIAAEFARRHPFSESKIISVSWNPGNLRSDLQRHLSRWKASLFGLIMYPPLLGAYTELYAACSSDITEVHNGAYIGPWGRIHSYRQDVQIAAANGPMESTGQGEKLWGWCEREARPYL